jgi:DNA polymerase (family 10)
MWPCHRWKNLAYNPDVGGTRNQAIAAEFRRIAAELERQQANPFRIRAYRRAADVVSRLAEDAKAIARRGELIRIKGIGTDLAKKIEQYCDQGHMETSPQEMPSDVTAWMSLPGFNESVVRYLYQRLHMQTLNDLEALVRSRFLRTLPDITATDEDILEGIARLRTRPASTEQHNGLT